MSRPDQNASDREIIEYLDRNNLLPEYARAEQAGFRGYYEDAANRYRDDARTGQALRGGPSIYRNRNPY